MENPVQNPVPGPVSVNELRHGGTVTLPADATPEEIDNALRVPPPPAADAQE